MGDILTLDPKLVIHIQKGCMGEPNEQVKEPKDPASEMLPPKCIKSGSKRPYSIEVKILAQLETKKSLLFLANDHVASFSLTTNACTQRFVCVSSLLSHATTVATVAKRVMA